MTNPPLLDSLLAGRKDWRPARPIPWRGIGGQQGLEKPVMLVTRNAGKGLNYLKPPRSSRHPEWPLTAWARLYTAWAIIRPWSRLASQNILPQRFACVCQKDLL
jgi:hypothetical protein